MDTAAQFAAADEEKNGKDLNISDSGEGAAQGEEKEMEDFSKPKEEEETPEKEGETMEQVHPIFDAPAGNCPSCGALYSARAKYCMQCGQKL